MVTHMLNIQIKTIPHHFQEYDTVGNYWRDLSGGQEVLEIRVSRMRDRRHEFLVALHELIEAFLCDWRRIPFGKITRFDVEYEKARGAVIPASLALAMAPPIVKSINSPKASRSWWRTNWKLLPQYNRAVQRL